MSQIDLQERLTYFEAKLEEAVRLSAAKNPHSPKFSAGFTTTKMKDWRETTALIQERITRIKAQLKEKTEIITDV
ncbi:hypothetical protein [Granulicella sp. dw_53]|uniref:hypothetical protein n=1 Tax=Granulicella sp. dw_53 TaxID=2719792 RepID=UPI001BD64DAC|nr:hypothetical protein [Granulicella sp. dw_53]